MDQQIADFEVAAARSALLARLAALERRVVGTTDEAIGNVKETAATVRSVVSGTAHDVRDVWTQVADNVRDSIDVAHHVRSHPWETIGMAAGLGFLAGFLPRSIPGPARAGQMSLVGDLLSVLRRELIGVGEATIAAGAAAIKQNLQEPREPSMTHGPLVNGRH